MAGSENGNFTMVPNDFIKNGTFAPSEKLVLLSLLCHTNAETGKAWPSHTTIAEEVNLSRRRVVDVLKGLEEKGIIETEKKQGAATQYKVRTCEIISHARKDDVRNDFSPPEKPFLTPCEIVSHPPEKWFHTNNTTRTRLKNNTREQEGRLASPDPWTRDQLAAIRQVVTAPRPAKLPELLAQWRETYGAQVVEQTIRKALRWMQDNGRQYTDMGRFLGNWLARDAARPRAKTQERVDYGDALPSWNDLLGGRQ